MNNFLRQLISLLHRQWHLWQAAGQQYFFHLTTRVILANAAQTGCTGLNGIIPRLFFFPFQSIYHIYISNQAEAEHSIWPGIIDNPVIRYLRLENLIEYEIRLQAGRA